MAIKYIYQVIDLHGNNFYGTLKHSLNNITIVWL